MITANYLTVTEFKNANPDVDLTNFPDATLSGVIATKSAWIDNFLNYSLGAEDIAGEVNESIVSSNGNLVIYPRKFPVLSVSAIQLKLGTVHLDLTLTDGSGNARYDITARQKSIVYPFQEISMTGVFSVRNFYQLRDREIFCKVSYRAGYETIPADIKDACGMLVRDHIVRNPTGATSITQGGISVNYGVQDDQGDTTLINQAKAILQSYRKFWS